MFLDLGEVALSSGCPLCLGSALPLYLPRARDPPVPEQVLICVRGLQFLKMLNHSFLASSVCQDPGGWPCPCLVWVDCLCHVLSLVFLHS